MTSTYLDETEHRTLAIGRTLAIYTAFASLAGVLILLLGSTMLAKTSVAAVCVATAIGLDQGERLRIYCARYRYQPSHR